MFCKNCGVDIMMKKVLFVFLGIFCVGIPLFAQSGSVAWGRVKKRCFWGLPPLCARQLWT
jgi:hypothetical protein